MILSHLASIDLNLLVVLQALLEERSVTRAAVRLGRTQSALSRSLGKLRALLDDPLLVRDGSTMLLTTRAENLMEPLADTLNLLERKVLSPEEFSPETAVGTLCIDCADYTGSYLLADALAEIVSQAPGLTIELPTAQPLTTEHFLIGPPWGGSEERQSSLLFEHGFLVMSRSTHPVVAEGMSLEAYLRYPHIVASPQGRPGSIVDSKLSAMGLSRRTAVLPKWFMVIPSFVSGSDMLSTVPSAFARWAAERYDLVLHPPPLDLPNIRMYLTWRKRWNKDSLHQWARNIIVKTVRAKFA